MEQLSEIKDESGVLLILLDEIGRGNQGKVSRCIAPKANQNTELKACK